MKKNGTVLAIDAGGTKVHLGVAVDGQIVCEEKIPTHAEQGAAQCIERMIHTAHQLRAEVGVEIQAVGLASPGIVNPQTKHTEHTWNIPLWDEFPVVQTLESTFSVPVAIENDANMGAIGESAYDHHGSSFIFFAVGTGFGAGLILNNRLWSGKRGGAGEIARWVMTPEGLDMDLNYGHLEYLMSGSGFETRYSEIVGNVLPGEQIAALAQKDDPVARRIFDEGATYLSIAAANVSTLLDLDAVVLGGGVIVRDADRWRSRVETITQKACLYPPRVIVSRLGERAVLLGAVAEAYRILGEGK